jgi:hypothetical protein
MGTKCIPETGMRRVAQPKWFKNAKHFTLSASIALGLGFAVMGDYAKVFEAQVYAAEAPTPPAEKSGVIGVSKALTVKSTSRKGTGSMPTNGSQAE